MILLLATAAWATPYQATVVVMEGQPEGDFCDEMWVAQQNKAGGEIAAGPITVVVQYKFLGDEVPEDARITIAAKVHNPTGPITTAGGDPAERNCFDGLGGVYVMKTGASASGAWKATPVVGGSQLTGVTWTVTGGTEPEVAETPSEAPPAATATVTITHAEPAEPAEAPPPPPPPQAAPPGLAVTGASLHILDIGHGNDLMTYCDDGFIQTNDFAPAGFAAGAPVYLVLRTWYSSNSPANGVATFKLGLRNPNGTFGTGGAFGMNRSCPDGSGVSILATTYPAPGQYQYTIYGNGLSIGTGTVINVQ